MNTTNSMSVSQEGFAYNEENLGHIEKYLSPERLAAYFALVQGNRRFAIQLYERNTELSEALYGVIQGLEVTLRNSIHNLMTRELGKDNWYEQIVLEPPELKSLQEAREKITGRGYKITPPRMVAELTFGFWVRLTASAYEKTIWVKHLHKIFPIRLPRKQLFQRLDAIKQLRNRIAHHEQIIARRDLPKEYENTLEAIKWMSPVMETWVRSTNCFPQRWAKKFKLDKRKVTGAVALPVTKSEQ